MIQITWIVPKPSYGKICYANTILSHPADRLPRILFLADRNILINQAKRGDFSPFKDKMTTIKNHQIDKNQKGCFPIHDY